jgi:hypothetical protein
MVRALGIDGSKGMRIDDSQALMERVTAQESRGTAHEFVSSHLAGAIVNSALSDCRLVLCGGSTYNVRHRLMVLGFGLPNKCHDDSYLLENYDRSEIDAEVEYCTQIR